MNKIIAFLNENRTARNFIVAGLIAICTGVLGLLTTALAPAPAQTGSVQTWEIPPLTIGVATPVDVCKLPGGPPCSPANPTVRLCFSKAGNTSGSASSITMCDKEAIPVCPWNAVPISSQTVFGGEDRRHRTPYWPVSIKLWQLAGPHGHTWFVSGQALKPAGNDQGAPRSADETEAGRRHRDSYRYP